MTLYTKRINSKDIVLLQIDIGFFSDTLYNFSKHCDATFGYYRYEMLEYLFRTPIRQAQEEYGNNPLGARMSIFILQYN